MTYVLVILWWSSIYQPYRIYWRLKPNSSLVEWVLSEHCNRDVRGHKKHKKSSLVGKLGTKLTKTIALLNGAKGELYILYGSSWLSRVVLNWWDDRSPVRRLLTEPKLNLVAKVTDWRHLKTGRMFLNQESWLCGAHPGAEGTEGTEQCTLLFANKIKDYCLVPIIKVIFNLYS